MAVKSSLRAQQVAKDVQKAILSGKIPAMGEIVEKRGYSKSTVINPKRVTKTTSYQEEMYNFAKELEKQRDRFLKEIATRDLSGEELKVVTEALDKLNKNLQLATGGNTENIGISLEISETIANKNGLSAPTPHK